MKLTLVRKVSVESWYLYQKYGMTRCLGFDFFASRIASLTLPFMRPTISFSLRFLLKYTEGKSTSCDENSHKILEKKIEKNSKKFLKILAKQFYLNN